jgi:hypothetical protein
VTRDPLEQLLRSADASPPGRSDSDLVGQVRRRARRSDRIRSTVASALVLIGVAIGAVALLQPSTHQPPTALAPDPIAVKAELARLDQEADRHSALADQMMQTEISTARPNLAELARDLQRERDEAALSLIYEAETLAPLPAQRPAAVALYRRAIDLFPQTHWAALAKQRLEALQSTQENL